MAANEETVSIDTVKKSLWDSLEALGENISGETLTELMEIIEGGGGGGTSVVANPTLEGNEDSLTGLKVGNKKYAVPQGGSGSEVSGENDGTNWTSLTIDGDTYDIPNELADLTADSTHRLVSDAEKSAWNAKSDFSGDYDDLTNKPTIPSEVTESTVSGWGFTKNTGTYSKPSGGIPENDLSSDVQAKLNGEIADVVLDSNLVGKKLSLIGDSITTYQGWLPSGNVTRYPRGVITNVEQTWWKKLLNETGMVIGQNCAYDGSTCSGLSTSTTNAYAGCSDKRISQLGLNGTPDIIICYIGINDWGATYNKNKTQYGGTFVDGAFIPVGDYIGETALPSGELKTFSEAYGCMIGKIQTQYPNSKIYCCTLPQTNGKAVYNYDADGSFPSINRDGVSIADYNDRIRMLANNFGVEIIEFAKCGINWGNMTTYMEDGLHPNPDGMTLLADTAKAKLYSDFGVSIHGGSPTPTPTPTIYTVTNTLNHVSNSNSATSAEEGSSYSATLSTDAGYVLHSVSITMGGVDVTSAVYNNGAITIANVSGNIVITAEATQSQETTYAITNNLTHVNNSNNAVSITEDEEYSATLTADSGYTIDSVTVEMGGVDITSTAYNNGSINISAVTGDIVITASATQEAPVLTWYTSFPQTSTSSFVASSKGWALDEETYANIYNKPINKISFVATASSGSMDFCIAPSKGAQTGFTDAQTINWTSANKSGNIVTIDIPEFTLTDGQYLCVYVNTTPASGAACYANGGNAGQFYSYVGKTGQNWGSKGTYSIQMNLGYES